MFNEDKKTDLIGECWIELESVLQRGGGQNDGWHDLNSKGRYAGQIRIELTFYDTRPKEQPEATPVDEASALPQDDTQDRSARATGPRLPPVKRRPLPATAHSLHSSPSEPQANVVPMPDSVPRSYRTPPRNTERHYSEPSTFSGSPVNDAYALASEHPDQWPRSPNPSVSESYHRSTAQPSYRFDDHYQQPREPSREVSEYDQKFAPENAFQSPDFVPTPLAVERDLVPQQFDDYEALPPAPLDDYRGSHNAHASSQRPPLPAAPLHAHSAPILAPHEQVSPDQTFTTAAMRHHGYSSPSDNHMSPVQSHTQESKPPAPPIHRNSLPLTTRTPQNQSPMQMSSGPRRALHHAANSDDVIPGYGPEMRLPAHQEVYSNQPFTPQPGKQESNDTFQGMQWEQDHRPSTQHPPNKYISTEYTNGSPVPVNSRSRPANPSFQTRPHSVAEHSSSFNVQQPEATTSTSSVPIVRPRPISPNAPAHSTTPTMRKPVGSTAESPSPRDDAIQQDTSSVPFSPDSFAQFNPRIQKGASAPSQLRLFDSSPNVQPMYGNSAQSIETEQGTASAEAPQTDNFGRIIRSDGRRVDPSDHLPSSTYAPEPEPKGIDKEKRTNIKTNLKTRFGPRDAISTRPGASVPLEATVETSPVPSPPVRTPPSHAMSRPRQTPPSQRSMTNLRQTPPSQSSMINTMSTPPSQQQMLTPTSVSSSSPLQSLEKSGRTGLQKRVPHQSSPLAPSPPNALNQAPYHSNAVAPPPVPGKIPLDASPIPSHEQNFPHEYTPPAHTIAATPPSLSSDPPQRPRRHGHTVTGGYQVQPGTSPNLALSQEISQIDLGPSPSQALAVVETEPRYGGLAGGRMRRSRFGA